MEKYNKEIAELSNVAFIHVSLDDDEDAAEEWAAKEGFPWFTVLDGEIKASGLDAYQSTETVPEYHLIDSEGNTIVAGSYDSTEAFKKIAELGETAKKEEMTKEN